jgi:prephenate dehydrogenase (NADP+)
LAAFEKYLPSDVEIVSCHSLHGPAVDPTGQPLVIIQHRASQESVDLCVRILSCLKSKMVYLSGEKHDRITADTQAVTHAAFLSMGTAWAANQQFPWEIDRYVGGIENVKINITLRIYANKWHVYAGLAILNPAAREQIRQYAQSVTELYKLMLGGHREELTKRIKTAGAAVFSSDATDQDLLLGDDVLDKFSLSRLPKERTPNNHLSLLGIVDCWWKLGIVPYDHMICSTPVSRRDCAGSFLFLTLSQLFRIWLGVTEYLFRNETLLDEVINTAIEDNTFRSDDLEFTFAARVS